MNGPPLHELSTGAAALYDSHQGSSPFDPEADDYPSYILESIADYAFSIRDWRMAWRGYADALRADSILVDQRKCVLHSGRCALYLNEVPSALAILSDFVETFPQDADGLFYLGRSFQRAHRYYDALNCLTAAQQLDPGNPNIHAAAGQLAHALAFEGFGHTDGARSGSYLAVAEAAFARALDLEEANFEALSGRLMFRLDCGQVGEALDGFQGLLAEDQTYDDERLSRLAVNLALALARGGHIEEVASLDCLAAFPAGEKILARARGLAGVPNGVARERRPAETIAIAFDIAAQAWVAGPCRERGWLGGHSSVLDDPWSALSVAADWVVPVRTTHWAAIRQMIERLRELPGDFAGIVTFASNEGPGIEPDARAPAVTNVVLRKPLWDEVIAAQPTPPSWEAAIQLALDRLRLCAHSTAPSATGSPATAGFRPSAPATDRVLVLSRHGPRRLGGGEQFLADAAAHYAERPGTEVFFAGLTDDPSEAVEAWPASRTAPFEGFLLEDREALRSFLVSVPITAIHTISGLGEAVLDAAEGLDIKFVYGVHFWREFVAGPVSSRPWYPNVGRAGAIRPAPGFPELIARADFTYVNSDFCRDIAAGLYGWRPPVLYSAPPPAAQSPSARGLPHGWPADYVLLANSRADKGWYLFLEVAAALTHREFVAIAGQTDLEAARADVQHRHLFNVTVIDRAENMDELYRHAAVVVVPSFAFVETFSRVAIEAGRHGRPVLMANAGNLSRFGAGTELVLPPAPADWTKAIEALFIDPAFRDRATRQSVTFSERFAHSALTTEFAEIPLARESRRILVCVGSGIGNVCHTTPLIRKLADHFGARIDVLVAGDFPGTGTVIAGSPHVSAVFENYAHVRYRRYDRVFVTHCFGSVVPAFNTPRIDISRDWEHFDPAGSLHEAEFNLAFLKWAAGVEYFPADVGAYFLGGWTWSPGGVGTAARPPRLALHAGSKEGVWSAKRWPHFATLARELGRLGVDVISLGVADEYVPGTIDKTGLSIERMTDELSVCDALVTNDSGVMNLANALGMPVVALFAPTNPATRGPLNSPSVVLTAQTGCAPCETRPNLIERFQQGACRCIALISPARVRKALGELGVIGTGAD